MRVIGESPSPFAYSEGSHAHHLSKKLVLTVFLVAIIALSVVLTFQLLPLVRASLAVDANAEKSFNNAASSGNVSVTTSTANDVIILYVMSSQISASGYVWMQVSSVSSSPSVTFAKRGSSCPNSSEYSSGYYTEWMEEWYATWSSSGTITITVNVNGTNTNGACYLFATAISGADTTTIFDSSSSYVYTADGGDGTYNPSVSITTSNANDLIISGEGCETYQTLINGTNFYKIKIVNQYGTEYNITSTTKSGFACNWALSPGGSQSIYCVIADAVKQVSSATYPPTYTTIGSNETIAGNVVNCYCLWAANGTAISGFIFSTDNGSAAYTNQTWTSSMPSNWGNYTFTLNVTVGSTVHWKEYCNDTANDWNTTTVQTITTTYYASVTVNTATHSWSLNPGSNNVTITENSGKISLTVTSNAAFDIQAEASAALVYGPYSIALTNTNMSASTWSVAIPLTTSYQIVPGLSNVAGGTGLSESFYLWLSCPTNTPAGPYTYTLTVEVTQH